MFFGEEFGASFKSLKDGLDEFFDDDGDKQMGASESKKPDNGDGDGGDDMGVSESKKPDNGDGDDDMPDSPPPEAEYEPKATPSKPKSKKQKRKGISPLKLLFGKSKSG